MFRLIRQVFFVLFTFIWSLAAKLASLSNDPFMIKPSLIDLNPVFVNYYGFIFGLDKYSRSLTLFKTYIQSYVFHVKQTT